VSTYVINQTSNVFTYADNIFLFILIVFFETPCCFSRVRPKYFVDFRRWLTGCTIFFNAFITILYMYMFRAISCSSSGGQMVLIQHLVSSPLSKWPSGAQACAGRSLTESDVTRCYINPLKPELNSICYLLALLAHHFLHVCRIRVKSLTFRRLMPYIYMEHPFLMFLDYTQRRSTVGRTPLDEW